MTIDIDTIQIEPKRKEVLKDEFQQPYFSEIKACLAKEKEE
jgi:hypothetical protein